MLQTLLSYFGILISAAGFVIAFAYQFISGYRSYRTIAIWSFALIGYGSYRLLDPADVAAAGWGWGSLGSGAFLLIVALITMLITETPRAERQREGQ